MKKLIIILAVFEWLLLPYGCDSSNQIKASQPSSQYKIISTHQESGYANYYCIVRSVDYGTVYEVRIDRWNKTVALFAKLQESEGDTIMFNPFDYDIVNQSK